MGAALLLAIAASAHAQPWPSHPVRFIIPFPAGGSTDIVGCRRLAERLGELPTLRNAPNNTPAEMIETLNREVSASPAGSPVRARV